MDSNIFKITSMNISWVFIKAVMNSAAVISLNLNKITMNWRKTQLLNFLALWYVGNFSIFF